MLTPATINVELPLDILASQEEFEAMIVSMNTRIMEGVDAFGRNFLGMFLNAGLDYCARLETAGADRNSVHNSIKDLSQQLCGTHLHETTTRLIDGLFKTYCASSDADIKGLDRIEHDYEGERYTITLR